MIQSMNKYSFLIYHREREQFLTMMQELGVLHITERIAPAQVESLLALEAHRRHLVTLERRLRGIIAEMEESAHDMKEDVADTDEVSVQEVEDALSNYDRSFETLAQLKQQVHSQEVWGDFDLDQVDRLRSDGYRLSLYTIASQAFDEQFVADYDAIQVGRIGAVVYFVRIERDGMAPCPMAESVAMPERRLSELYLAIEQMEQSIQEQRETIYKNSTAWLAELKRLDKSLASQYALGNAQLQLQPQAGDKLMFLEGWIPTIKAHDFEQALSSSEYYWVQSEIEADDQVPVALKNNFFVRLFEPIGRLFSLPNYNEIDQTVLFAPFFMLFFALCFGDGGYGLLVFVVATLLSWLRKDIDRSILRLVQWLGGASFVVGMLMGSFFGVTLGYARAEDYFLNQNVLMNLSLVLGLIQILVGKLAAAYKTKVQRGLKFALAPFAWVVLLTLGGILIMVSNLAIVLPIWLTYILYAVVAISVLIVLLYNMPGKNPFVNLGSALWTTYNVASGLLGDTLSYIRLFAIGLTGSILGGVFNQLAIDQTAGLPFWIQYPLMIVILLFGHGLNIALALISSFVHPLRLTFVEFYKNSEFEGGGKPYTPLSK